MNGLQVEGQGSVQERTRFRVSPTGSLHAVRQIIAASKTLQTSSASRLRSFSQSIASTIRLFEFSKFRDVSRRGLANYIDLSTRVKLLRPLPVARSSWWRKWDSNPRPSACKADALPAELFAPDFSGLPARTARSVGLERFELSTPRLSSVCSNQLSYRPRLDLRTLQRALVGPSKLNSKIEKKLILGHDLDLVALRRMDHVSRKEVIQPQVPLRLPCYDFTPVTSHSLGSCLPCGWHSHFWSN